MEPFTNGKVSGEAREAYLADHPWVRHDQFRKTRGGFVMYAWESQIAFCRASGRGVRSGLGRKPHPFDVAR